MRRIVTCALMATLGLSASLLAEDNAVSAEVAGATDKQKSTGAMESQNAQLLIGRMTASGVSDEATGAALSTEPKDSKFWIGLSCVPVDETLRSQLGLESGSGLVVRQIADNGPAKDAGLAIHDIITHVTVGDQTHRLANSAALTSLVQQSGTNRMVLLLRRRNKPLHVSIAPKDRKPADPKRNLLISGAQPQLAGSSEELNSMSFRMVGPVVTFGTSLDAFNLPEDLTVVITKSGSQPLRIKIQQKDRGEWGLKEKESAEQPEYVSQAVIGVMTYLSHFIGRMTQQEGRPVFTLELGHKFHSFTLPPSMMMRPGPMVDGPGAAVVPMQSPTSPPTLNSIQQRLDEFQKQQEQLSKTLEELRQALPKPQPTKQ